MLSFFPRDDLDEFWDLIGSVSEGFPTYFSIVMAVEDLLYVYPTSFPALRKVENGGVYLRSIKEGNMEQHPMEKAFQTFGRNWKYPTEGCLLIFAGQMTIQRQVGDEQTTEGWLHSSNKMGKTAVVAGCPCGSDHYEAA